MAYIKKGFTNGVTLLDAEHFNHMEEGIAALDTGKQNKLTGSQGQIVGFDANGNAVAQAAPESGGGTVEVDATLSVAGKAADAKAAGDAIAAERTARANAISAEEAARKAEIAIERARINALASLPAGSTSGDAELIDGRIGADGKTYINIGEAIRTQIANLDNRVDDSMMNYQYTICNLLNPDAILKNTYCNPDSGGSYSENTAYYTTDMIRILPGQTLVIRTNVMVSRNARAISAFDKNGTFTRGVTNTDSFTQQGDDYFVVFSLRNDNSIPTEILIADESIGSYMPYGEPGQIKAEYLKNAAFAISNVDIDATTFKNKYTVSNLLNPAEIQEGVYCDTNHGGISSNAAYFITGKIKILPGQTLFFFDTEMKPVQARMTTAFDKNGSYTRGLNHVTSFTQEGNDAYIVVTLAIGTQESTMIADGAAWRFMSYGEPEQIMHKYLEATEGGVADSLVGTDAARVERTNIAAGGILTLNNFPCYLKNGQSISFAGDFTTFSGVKVGKGYNSYRGRWLEIDGTNVVNYGYESSANVIETVKHSLTISGYISVAIDVNGADCKATINTLSGTFTHTFNWGCEANGDVFAKPTAAMTGCTLSATSGKFRHPLWMFGDSYFGVSDDRVIGQLKNLGYFENILVDGLAGQASSGAYTDLVKCLNHGTPKYLLWCLGMNDNDSGYSECLPKLKNICEIKGITLILAKIPTVPDRNKETLNTYVTSSGCRYIDFYRAVGANSSGVWRNGYLSTDGVHPTQLGAKALAAQVLVDAPEIMQY